MNVTPLSKSPAWMSGALIDPKRFDTGYYDPSLTVAESLMREGKHVPWKRLGKVGRVYNFGAYELTNSIKFVEKSSPGAVPFVTITNINNLTVDFDAAPWIDQASHQILSASICRPGIVMVSIAGTIGRAGVVPSTLPECNGNQAIAKIDVNEDECDPHFLAAYLTTRVGCAASEREAAGAVQKNLYIYNVEEIPVPCPVKPIRTSVGHKVRAAERLRATADAARELVESQFPNFELQERPLSGQWLGNRVLDTERLEAQYYQPHFLELMKTIDSLPCKMSPLRQLVATMRHGASVTGANTIGGRVRFIRGTEVRPNRIATDDVVYLDDGSIDELATPHFVKKGDLLVTRSGTVGSCAVVREKEIGVAFGSFVIAVQIDKESGVAPEYVSAFLNSPLGQAQFRREENGAVQMNINNGELCRIRIPLFTGDVRDQVVDHVNQYNSSLDRAEMLVSSAISDVENLIDGKLDEDRCLAEGRKLAEEFGLEVP